MAFRRFCSDKIWFSLFWGVESRGFGREDDGDAEEVARCDSTGDSDCSGCGSDGCGACIMGCWGR